MRITQTLYDAMIEHARDDLPDECCGLVVCDGDEAVEIYPVNNIRPSGGSFLMDPVDVAQVFDRALEAGQQVGALYHSHPSIPAVPSMIDVGDAAQTSGMIWIIIGNLGYRWRRRIWETTDEPDVWAWRIEGGRVFTAELTVTTEGGAADNAGSLAIQTEGKQ